MKERLFSPLILQFYQDISFLSDLFDHNRSLVCTEDGKTLLNLNPFLEPLIQTCKDQFIGKTPKSYLSLDLLLRFNEPYY